MRRIRYSVAMSLDGYIAGPNGEADWIMMDPEIDFKSLMGSFDTLLMGRKTYEAAQAMGGAGMPGMKSIVVSRTLRPTDHPKLTIIGDNLAPSVKQLCEQSGKDIWLFGGGALFRSMLDQHLVDAVEVAVIPVILGGGIPLVTSSAQRAKLKLVNSRVYRKTGTVALEYAVAE